AIELPQAPMIAGTRSRTMSFSAALAASFGSDLLSSITRSIFRPLTPPRALSQSRAISAPIRTQLPDAATGPERGSMTPILISACDCAGPAVVAIAARTRATRTIHRVTIGRLLRDGEGWLGVHPRPPVEPRAC